MGDNIYWRYGHTNPVATWVGPGTAIDVGDLVWQDVLYTKPASDLPLAERRLGCQRCGSVLIIPATSRVLQLPSGRICQECGTRGAWLEARPSEVLQRLFSDHFVGLALQPSPFGVSTIMLVATTGVFEFDCPQHIFKRGALVGVDWEGVEGQAIRLLSQKVIPVTATAAAIGWTANWPPGPVTSVLVKLNSTVIESRGQ